MIKTVLELVKNGAFASESPQTFFATSVSRSCCPSSSVFLYMRLVYKVCADPGSDSDPCDCILVLGDPSTHLLPLRLRWWWRRRWCKDCRSTSDVEHTRIDPRSEIGKRVVDLGITRFRRVRQAIGDTFDCSIPVGRHVSIATQHRFILIELI